MSASVILFVGHPETFADSRTALTAAGFEVFAALDLKAGLKSFSQRHPDLVIVRGRCPDGPGTELHRHIRDVGSAATPVVYLVEPAEGRIRDDAGRLGAAAILEQPVDPPELVAAVEQCLGRPAPDLPRGTMRVLVVEDDLVQSRLIERCLQTGRRKPIDVRFARSAADACRIIRDGRFDCVLLDHNLPDGEGIDVLEQAEEHLLTTPVIGLSASIEATTALAYLRGGCVDFLLKEDALRAGTLRRGIAEAVSRFQRRAMATILERKQLRTAIDESQERLITLARTDHLMGICNRAVFDDYHVDYHGAVAARGDCYTLCMIDVDRFKAFNDHYGHAGGDEALRSVAQRLARAMRGEDFVARYGGEELVVLLDRVGYDTAERVADRLRNLVYELAIPHAGNPGHERLTISIGAAVFDPDHPVGHRQLRLAADEALYRAKDAGRNRLVIAPPASVDEPVPV